MIRNSIFHLRPENVSHNMRLNGNKGQYFLYEGRKLIAYVLTMFEYSIQIRHKAK